MTNQSTIFIC